MKNILKIFIRDIKNIIKNPITIVVLGALMVIPSLYSLINIKASWDPYTSEATSGIKVAIVNEDAGTEFKDKQINLGDELVKKLQDNDKIGWNFVDKETAQNGLLMEEYYAMIEIPEEFSEDVTTLVEKDIKNPQLIYTVNEKINAIAPKMTDSAVKTVKSQLDDNIKKVVSGIIFRACNEAGINIEENRPELRRIMDSVYDINEKMPELEEVLNSAIDGTVSVSQLMDRVKGILPNANDIIDAADGFIEDSQKSLDETQSDLSEISPVIKEELVSTENLLDNAEIILGNIDENILPETYNKTLLTVIDTAKASKVTDNQIKERLENIKKFLDKVSEIEIPKPNIDETLQDAEEIERIKELYKKQVELLETLQQSAEDSSEIIDNAIDRLDTIDEKLDIIIERINDEISKVNSGEKPNIQSLTDTRKLINDVHKLISDNIDIYDSEITPIVKNSLDSIREISDNGSTLLNQSKDVLPDIENMLDTFINISSESNEKLIDLKEHFPDIKDKISKLSAKLKEFDNQQDIDEVLKLLTNDWDAQSDFFASPIEIEDNRLFPWPNYGSTATPFYTVLCLWIGGYMLSMLLNTEAHLDYIELKPYQKYFGKLILFMVIGIFQAIIASLGAILILKVYVVHPVMFVFFSIFVSIVFMSIIYTAVSLFGNGGIAIGIILLVLQVAGTGANFPIEVNPEMFQKLYPFLPFTYAIGGMRQIMAGIVYSILIKDILILIIYMVMSIITGVLFKKLINKWIHPFNEKLKESNLM